MGTTIRSRPPAPAHGRRPQPVTPLGWALPLAAVTLLAVGVSACGGSSSRSTESKKSSAGKSTAVGDSAPGRPRPHYRVRGIYDRDFSRTGFADERRLGFNFIDTTPSKEEVDALASHGLKGFIWLGGYSNDNCKFNESDAWLRSHVRAIARSPGVGAYFIDDEPDAAKCPDAPAQMKARSDLVKSIDRGRPTFIVTYHVDQLPLFARTVDVIGLDHYPCTKADGCDYSKIDRQAAEADRLGIRYWGVIQAHGDDYYKLPTPAEVHRQFVHWRATRMRGYLVFAWRWPPDRPSLWLAHHPELQSQLARENAR